MANPYFRFKKFIIHHDRCAMKVCTDACLLGAWFAKKISGKQQLLDIGSGSGLLMMMLAQYSSSVIHGIEIDREAYEQSLDNIHQWHNPDNNVTAPAGDKFNNGRLQVFNGDVRSFSLPFRYDFIITNPPFYGNDLQSSLKVDNMAKHSVALDYAALINSIHHNLSDDGSFGILLPIHRAKEFEKLAGSGFRLIEKLLIRQTTAHDHFRGILYFERKKKNISVRIKTSAPEDYQGKKTMEPLVPGVLPPALEYDLSIKDEQGNYTVDFVALLKDYYLYL